MRRRSRTNFRFRWLKSCSMNCAVQGSSLS
uniref:Uncharacterized protein n=1 Tax=Arundo donax TaxID=35708 RepID=A0A0A8YQ45_ARUDO